MLLPAQICINYFNFSQALQLYTESVYTESQKKKRKKNINSNNNKNAYTKKQNETSSTCMETPMCGCIFRRFYVVKTTITSDQESLLFLVNIYI